VAAKHDGKHARANMWVTHQNLAKAKGGRPLYQPKDRKVPFLPKPVASHDPKPVEAAPAVLETPPQE
jgi:hypothetical protein